jgi:hypothetical protein
MIKNRICFFAFFILMTALSGLAQLPDGVHATSSFVQMLLENYTSEQSLVLNPGQPDSVARVPVHVHVIKNIIGSTSISRSTIQNGLSMANSHFREIGIQFVVDSFETISDYNYGYITSNQNRSELLARHALPFGINLFLADSLSISGNKCYGYTWFPDMPDSNYIFMDKQFFTGNALSTQLGHFMGLLSTHDTLGGIERVNEANCEVSGDYCCDTYADPGLFGKVEKCIYTGDARDPEGYYYVPTVANIMSDTSDECKCLFTPMQYRRMYYYFKEYRIRK